MIIILIIGDHALKNQLN